MIDVRPHLWFANNRALEAANFYAEHIPDSTVSRVMTAPEGVPDVTPGSDFIVEFTVAGLEVIGLNAGPALELTPAFSLYLLLDPQDEVDRYWNLLTDGGTAMPCGWCTDRFGVSWQVIPRRLEELCGDYTSEANLRAMRAMLEMGKIDIAALERAHAGEDAS
jgi:predicted 3-demethylubiquinone-9 3-methyltransferase (glyoxalase superfamily)